MCVCVCVLSLWKVFHSKPPINKLMKKIFLCGFKTNISLTLLGPVFMLSIHARLFDVMNYNTPHQIEVHKKKKKNWENKMDILNFKWIILFLIFFLSYQLRENQNLIVSLKQQNVIDFIIFILFCSRTKWHTFQKKAVIFFLQVKKRPYEHISKISL